MLDKIEEAPVGTEGMEQVVGEVESPPDLTIKKEDVTPASETPKAEDTKPPTAEELMVQLKELKSQYDELQKNLRPPEKKVEEKKVEVPKWKPRFTADRKLAELFVEDPDKAAEMLNQMYMSALQDVAELMIPAVEQMVGQRITPLQASYEQAQMDAHTKAFLGKYKDLEPYIDEAREVANQLLGDPNAQFKSVDEVYDAVAKETRVRIDRWKARLGTGASTGGSPGPEKAGGSKARVPVRQPSKIDEEKEEDVMKAVLGE